MLVQFFSWFDVDSLSQQNVRYCRFVHWSVNSARYSLAVFPRLLIATLFRIVRIATANPRNGAFIPQTHANFRLVGVAQSSGWQFKPIFTDASADVEFCTNHVIRPRPFHSFATNVTRKHELFPRDSWIFDVEKSRASLCGAPRANYVKLQRTFTRVRLHNTTRIHTQHSSSRRRWS